MDPDTAGTGLCDVDSTLPKGTEIKEIQLNFKSGIKGGRIQTSRLCYFLFSPIVQESTPECGRSLVLYQNERKVRTP